MERNPKYSDSVNAMNGCLRFFWLVYLCLVILMLAPYIGILLLCWWVIAWILGLIFPGREFFPIKRILTSISSMMYRYKNE